MNRNLLPCSAHTPPAHLDLGSALARHARVQQQRGRLAAGYSEKKLDVIPAADELDPVAERFNVSVEDLQRANASRCGPSAPNTGRHARPTHPATQ